MHSESCLIKVSIDEQRLQLLAAGKVKMDVAVATATNGPGEIMHSECTPRGWHRVRAKIGAGAPENTVFTGRRPTGEIYSPALRQEHPGRDWMLTRLSKLCCLTASRIALTNSSGVAVSSGFSGLILVSMLKPTLSFPACFTR